MKSSIDQLVISDPYKEPEQYWKYDPTQQAFAIATGRRPAGYVIASTDSRSFDDPGQYVEIPLINRIRPRVKAWRGEGYPGVSPITRKLLEYWQDPVDFSQRRFFFCQLEAAETLIWLTEASVAEKVGLEIPSDGGDFVRQCCKMATGSGKTIVMAMIIAWQTLNKLANPLDTRFSKNVLVIAPGLTVKNRLGVLYPNSPSNFYEQFRVVPADYMPKLREGRVLVRNWHALKWEDAEKISRRRSVDKRGPMSDEAYARQVLGDMAGAKNLLVINDEAHHAWRLKPNDNDAGSKEEREEATIWVGGLDRLNKARGILRAYDFTATPFVPTGNRSTQETLFDWVVSDFGLNDAIEAGLVKTPRVVVRDDAIPDATSYRSRMYHIYNDPEVKDDLNRKADENDPLPDLVMNAYALLGFDWQKTAQSWGSQGLKIPPVMISVCNRTETAKRVARSFEINRVPIPELCAPNSILHIDSKVLREAEEQDAAEIEAGDDAIDDDAEEEALTKKESAELLRRKVDTVGKLGKSGEQIRNVISVSMLSEGWDAQNVTHIMGLRAFHSQLLCEQVVGRGLRRNSYEVDPKTGLFEPEYVNIFGVPFSFLPHESETSGAPKPPRPKFPIYPEASKSEFEISWPNVLRLQRVTRPNLTLDVSKVGDLEIDATKTAVIADLAPIIDGKPDLSMIDQIQLVELGKQNRYQKIAFEIARDLYERMKSEWPGQSEYLMAQLVQRIDDFIRSDRLIFAPENVALDPLMRRLLITLNLSKIGTHILDGIRHSNTESLELILDHEKPIKRTGDMQLWYTTKPRNATKKSHINDCVYDSTWESSDAYELDHSKNVVSWAKNDHLGFEIPYLYRGIVHKYRPDFLVRLADESMLVVETKGEVTEQDNAKWDYMREWLKAVNSHGGFGRWDFFVSDENSDLRARLTAQVANQQLISAAN